MLGYVFLNEKYSLSFRRPTSKCTILLPGAGCEYWKKTGGCSMCGFHLSTQRWTLGYRLPPVVFKLLFNLARHQINKSEQLSIFNGGSFFNDREIPALFRGWLYQKIANSSLLELFVETRCEYLDAEELELAVSLLNAVKLVVGIGLESQDGFVRNKLIGKGLSRKLFEQKVELLRSLGISPMAYVFLKPLGLEEAEALEEVIKTIIYSLAVGVERIQVSCAFVQEGTRMAKAYMAGRYKPPSLSTIIKLIGKIQEEKWPVSIGGFSDEPRPIAIPKCSCDKCSSQIYDSIERFRRTREWAVPSECISCSCCL